MKVGKAIVFGVLLSLAFIAFTGIASASTIYVPDVYSTIQAAVNAASSDDTIVVRDGTYTENVKVDKTRLTIRSQKGPDSTIVLAEDSDDNVFEVTANYVNISGFTVKGATGFWRGGIYLDADYCNISNNNCSNDCGIYLEYSNNNCISNNICSNNDDGILLAHSNNNSISNNNCPLNNEVGIILYHSNNNSISNNNCTNNKYGIDLGDSNNNHIYLNNFINNFLYNVNSSESTNTWNSPEKITYSYGRRTYTSCLGNYYDDYTGTDRNLDGIGDIPYQIDEDSDMYPLMKPWENYHAASERQSKIIYFILRWILED